MPAPARGGATPTAPERRGGSGRQKEKGRRSALVPAACRPDYFFFAAATVAPLSAMPLFFL